MFPITKIKLKTVLDLKLIFFSILYAKLLIESLIPLEVLVDGFPTRVDIRRMHNHFKQGLSENDFWLLIRQWIIFIKLLDNPFIDNLPVLLDPLDKFEMMLVIRGQDQTHHELLQPWRHLYAV